MYQYKKDPYNYQEAIKLKHEENIAIAKEHNVKKTEINVLFDSVDDVANFNEAVFKAKDREKVFKVEPNFLNPRKMDDLYKDFKRQIYHHYYPKEEEELSCDEYIPRNRHYYDMASQEGWSSQHYEKRSNIQKHEYPVEYYNYYHDTYLQDDDNNFVIYNDAVNLQQRLSEDHGNTEVLSYKSEEDAYDEATKRNTLLNAESDIALTTKRISPVVNAAVRKERQYNLHSSNQIEIKKKKKWWKLFESLSNRVKKHQNRRKLLVAETIEPVIQLIPIADNMPLGDVLDSEQQRKILSQLQQQDSPLDAQQHTICSEKTRITRLERVWVFRLISDGNRQSKDHIAWIGFDYENQILIENYTNSEIGNCTNDENLVLYDSHIRHKDTPVIVIPSKNKGYFFTDTNQSELCTLEFQWALGKLTTEETTSVLRFKFARDQHLALASILLRRYYFSKLLNVPWDELEFGKHQGGKPFLKNHADIDFNTSHDGNWVIFGCIKGMKIGVDVVNIVRPTTGSIDDFINSFEPQLAKDEMKLIMNSKSDKLSTFYEIWGCKESYTKAIGVGLYLELQELSFSNQDKQIKLFYKGKQLESWCFHIVQFDFSTIAVVCCGDDMLPAVTFEHPTKLIVITRMAEISEDAREAITSHSRKRQSVLSLSESARKIQRLSLNTPERLNYYFDRLQTPEQQADRIESRPVAYDYDEERTINSSRTSILSEASLSEYVRQFNESQQETHERKIVYDTKPFKDPEQQKGYITKIASFLLQTEYAKELPSIRRNLRSLTSSDFQAMVRHLLKIIDPDIELLRNFHEELPKTLRMLQCPLADVITPKTLLSIGAPHSYPNFLALLYWMAELCKGIQAPINDDDDDMSGLMFDKNYFDYIFSNHAFNAQTEYMNGMEDMSESNKEFEEVLAKTELMAADIKEKINLDIESLQDQLEEFHRTNPTLEYVTKRNIDLTTDIEKFKAYCEKKSRKIEKSVALEGKSKEQIARFEREKEIIEAEINKHSQDLQNRNLTVDEVNTTLLELKISTKLAAIPALEIREDELKIEFDPISEDPIKDFPIDFQTKHIPALEKVYKYYREEVHTMTINISKLREKLEEIVKEISDIQAKTQLNMKMSEKRKEEYEEREAKWQQDNLASVKLLEAEEREIEERETTAKNELSAADQELYEINKQVIERRIEMERNKAENQEKYLRFVQDLRRKIIEIEEIAKKTHEQVKADSETAIEIMKK
ncbi:hypothetical protein G6F43_009208 [Rhizopus delemar]|nr:hypothetical protein G6F43_009208 [Rhizopus delemar]